MLGRFLQWQVTVLHSQGPAENACNPALPPPPGPPKPTLPVVPVVGMQGVKQRCAPSGDDHIGTTGGRSVDDCAWHCHDATGVHGGFRASPRCHFFSFSKECDECWLYEQCHVPRDHGATWAFNWSTYRLV
jgi:hypothetical protein